MWSRSQCRDGLVQPGKTQCGSRSRTKSAIGRVGSCPSTGRMLPGSLRSRNGLTTILASGPSQPVSHSRIRSVVATPWRSSKTGPDDAATARSAREARSHRRNRSAEPAGRLPEGSWPWRRSRALWGSAMMPTARARRTSTSSVSPRRRKVAARSETVRSNASASAVSRLISTSVVAGVAPGRSSTVRAARACRSSSTARSGSAWRRTSSTTRFDDPPGQRARVAGEHPIGVVGGVRVEVAGLRGGVPGQGHGERSSTTWSQRRGRRLRSSRASPMSSLIVSVDQPRVAASSAGRELGHQRRTRPGERQQGFPEQQVVSEAGVPGDRRRRVHDRPLRGRGEQRHVGPHACRDRVLRGVQDPGARVERRGGHRSKSSIDHRQWSVLRSPCPQGIPGISVGVLARRFRGSSLALLAPQPPNDSKGCGPRS